MKTVHSVIAEYLMSAPLNAVQGANYRTLQNQGMEDGYGPIWAYDENGDPVGAMPMDLALEYIGV